MLETYTSQLPSPPAVVPAQKNQSIQRFLDMSKKNTLNISALFEKSFSKPPGNSEMRHRDGASDLLSSLLLDDSSVSLSSLTMESTIHHQKPTAPRRMQKKSVEIQTEETESMPPPMQQEQKGQTETPQLSETQDPGLSLNPSFTKAFSTTAATLTKSSDLKCGCQTVLSFCPLCSGVHQQLRKQPSFSSVRSLTVPLSQALRPVTIDQSRSLSQSLNSMKAPQAQNSFLFGNETSMLKSLADIVLEMEGAPLTPPIVKRVQMRRSVSREIGSQRQRSHSSKRRSKSKVNCGPESSVISLDPDLHLVLSLLKS